MRAFITFISIALTSPAFAMEPGTYRPGQAYHSTPANNANYCASQCQSDSQCKGWNFVRLKQNTASGICEFNARRSAPVSSPVSISGDSIDMNRTSARLVSAGTRTLRVGSQPAPRQAAPSHSTRRIMSQPIPNQQSARRVTYNTPPQEMPQHALDSSPHYNAPQMRPTPNRQAPTRQAPSLTQRFQHSLDSGASRRQTQPQMMAQPQMAGPHQAPRQDMRQNRPMQSPPPQHTSKPRPDPQTAPQQMLAPRAQAQVQALPIRTQTKPNSLYGSLFDDVKVPKALSPQDIPTDSDAPIPTVSSVPTEKVATGQLYGMAGPQPR